MVVNASLCKLVLWYEQYKCRPLPLATRPLIPTWAYFETRTRQKPGLVFEKTRTWLLKTRTRNRKKQIRIKDSAHENEKVFAKI
jgi:hypothetical protein